MENLRLKHTKVNRYYRAKKSKLYASIIVVFSFAIGGCKFWNGTYYSYLTAPPKVTTDSEEAACYHCFTQKELNDSVYYYYTEGKHLVTKDCSMATYTTRIGQFKHGRPVKLVWLDGLKDTMGVELYGKGGEHLSDVYYYGEKNVKLQQEYKGGKLHGTVLHFYPNGQPKEITNWRDGLLCGDYFNYYPDGQLRIKGHYTNGLCDKTFTYFNEFGDTLEIEHWEEGLLIDSLSGIDSSFSATQAQKQTDNWVYILEEAVIEYYDTLLSHQNYRLQKYRRGELFDTNIYLYMDVALYDIFTNNLHNPSQIPSHIIYWNGNLYQNMKLLLDSPSTQWTPCPFPSINKKCSLEVMEIPSYRLNEDTLTLHMKHYYINREKDWYRGKIRSVMVWTTIGSATWKYIFSEERRKWICVEKKWLRFKRPEFSR